MSRTELSGKQVKDGSVQRVDMDVSTSGQAVTTKIVAGDNISLSSTGVDAGTGDVTVSLSDAVHTTQYTETVANAFNSALSPSAGSLSVDCSAGNAVLGALDASVTEWAFTNVSADNSKVTTVVAVLDGNSAYTYGDACSVNGTSITDGVIWAGGTAPTATDNIDMVSFVIVKDSAGTIKVFGSAVTDFS